MLTFLGFKKVTPTGVANNEDRNLSNITEEVEVESMPTNADGVRVLELTEVENPSEFLRSQGISSPIGGEIVQAHTSLGQNDSDPNRFVGTVFTVDSNGDGGADRAFAATPDGRIQDFTAAWFAQGANGVLEGVPVGELGQIEDIRFDTNIFFIFPENGPVNFWGPASVNGSRFLSLDFDLSEETFEVRDIDIDLAFTAIFDIDVTQVNPERSIPVGFGTPPVVPTVGVGVRTPFFGLTQFAGLAGAQNTAQTPLSYSPTIRQTIRSESDCPCEGADETITDAVQKTDEAFEDFDLETPTETEKAEPKQKQHRRRDELFEEGFGEEFELLSDAPSLKQVGQTSNSFKQARKGSGLESFTPVLGTAVIGLGLGSFVASRRNS